VEIGSHARFQRVVAERLRQHDALSLHRLDARDMRGAR
jgi:hypothetical protein